MARPRGEAEVRDVTLSVKVTRAMANALYDRAKAEGLRATDVHRDALSAALDAAQPDWREAAAEVYAGFSATDPIPLPEPPPPEPDPPMETSPKVVHRHKPAPEPALTRYVKGTRYITPVCLICGEVLIERRG